MGCFLRAPLVYQLVKFNVLAVIHTYNLIARFHTIIELQPVLVFSDSLVISHVGFKLQLKQSIKRVDYPIRHVSIKTPSYLDVFSAKDVLYRYCGILINPTAGA
jgi:hypothetical protein